MTLKLTPRTWLALLALGPAMILAIQLLPVVRSAFLLLLVTALLSLLIYPLADRMERRGVSRGTTTGVVLIGALVILVGLLLLLVPVLIESLSRLAVAIQALTAGEAGEVGGIAGLPELANLGRDLLGQISGAIQWAAGQFGSLLGQLGALAFAAFVAFSLIFALVAEKRTAPALMRLLLPERYHARATSLTRAVSAGLSRWFIAQLAICAYYVVAYSLTLLVLRVPFAIQIGVTSGLLEFIPYLGGIVGLVLSALAAATVSPLTVLLVVAIEAVIGFVAVTFVVPFAFARAINVPPALILLGLFVGGQIGGFFAALLTVPLIAAALVVVRELRPDLAPAEPEVPLKREVKPTARP